MSNLICGAMYANSKDVLIDMIERQDNVIADLRRKLTAAYEAFGLEVDRDGSLCGYIVRMREQLAEARKAAGWQRITPENVPPDDTAVIAWFPQVNGWRKSFYHKKEDWWGSVPYSDDEFEVLEYGSKPTHFCFINPPVSSQPHPWSAYMKEHGAEEYAVQNITFGTEQKERM